MTSLCNDNTNVENMFNKAINMVINAYETQVNLFMNEIHKLNAQVQEKEIQFNKLQEICAKLLHDKKNYETKLTESQSYTVQLQDKIEKLSKENIELKTIKATILATIEDNNNNNNSNGCKDNDNCEMMQQNKVHPKSTNVSMGNIFINYKQSFPRKLPNNNYNTHNSSTLLKTCCDNNNNRLGNSFNSPHTVKERRKNPISFKKHISTSVHCGSKKGHSERKEQNKYCQSEGKVYKPVMYFDRYENVEKKCEKENVDFFKKCRKEMNKNDYVNLIDVVHLYNHKSIGKDVMYQKIKMIFNEGNYKELFNDFNNLFTQVKG